MKLKELFKNKSTWTQRANARNIRGRVVACKSRQAVKWCLNGGRIKCGVDFDVLFKAISPDLEWRSLQEWNDDKNRKFSDIKKLVNKLDI